MDVILRRDIDKLGSQGEVVTVPDGYGRNYLIPQGLAWTASTKAKRALEEEQRAQGRKSSRERGDAQALAEKIEQVSCTISMRVGADEKLYGSVTSQHVAESLAGQGIEIDHRKVELEEPIRELGVFRVPVKVHPDVTAAVKVWVVRE